MDSRVPDETGAPPAVMVARSVLSRQMRPMPARHAWNPAGLGVAMPWRPRTFSSTRLLEQKRKGGDALGRSITKSILSRKEGAQSPKTNMSESDMAAALDRQGMVLPRKANSSPGARPTVTENWRMQRACRADQARYLRQAALLQVPPTTGRLPPLRACLAIDPLE